MHTQGGGAGTLQLISVVTLGIQRRGIQRQYTRKSLQIQRFQMQFQRLEMHFKGLEFKGLQTFQRLKIQRLANVNGLNSKGV